MLLPELCCLTSDPKRLAVRLQEYPLLCPTCGRLRTAAGTYWRTLRHGTILSYRIRVSVQVQRLHCNHCDTTPGVEQPGLPAQQQHTGSLAECAEESLARRHSHTDIAAELGCSRRTVARIADAWVQRLDAQRDRRAPHTLSLDEIHVSCGTICVVADPTARRPVEVLEDYGQAAVEKFVGELANPEDVWVVTLDMAFHFADVVRRMLPHARLVIDPWHVKKTLIACFRRLIDAAIHQMSRQSQAELRKRKNRQLLVTRFGNLKLNGKTKEIARIQTWCTESPLLAEGYRYLQRMYTLWDRPIDSTRAANLFRRFTFADLSEEARQFIQKPLFKGGKRAPSFLQQVQDHWEAVLAYWDTGLTSGYIEALNHVIRDLDRNARGMSFPRLRGMVLYGVSATHLLGEKRFRKPRKLRKLPEPMSEARRRSLRRRGRGRKKSSDAQMELALPPPQKIDTDGA